MKKWQFLFFFLGGGGGVRGSWNLGGSSTSFKLSTTKDSKKLMIYMQFSYSVTPPPRVSGSAPDVLRICSLRYREVFISSYQ